MKKLLALFVTTATCSIVYSSEQENPEGNSSSRVLRSANEPTVDVSVTPQQPSVGINATLPQQPITVILSSTARDEVWNIPTSNVVVSGEPSPLGNETIPLITGETAGGAGPSNDLDPTSVTNGTIESDLPAVTPTVAPTVIEPTPAKKVSTTLAVGWQELTGTKIREIYAAYAAKFPAKPNLNLVSEKDLITDYDTLPLGIDFTGFDPYVFAKNIGTDRTSDPDPRDFRRHVATIVVKAYLRGTGSDIENNHKTRGDVALREVYTKLFATQGIDIGNLSLDAQRAKLDEFKLKFCKPLGFNPQIVLSRPNLWILDFPGLDGASRTETNVRAAASTVLREKDRVAAQVRNFLKRI